MSEIRMIGPSEAIDHALFEDLQRRVREEMDRAMRLPDQFFKPEPISISTMSRDRLMGALRQSNTQLEQAGRNLAKTMMPLMQNAVQSLCGMMVQVSAMIPKHRELIGHIFNADIPLSKHRSKRQWKKLRYGTRKNPKVKPLYLETEQVFMLPGGRAVVSPEVMKQMAVLHGL